MSEVEPPRLLASLAASWEHEPTEDELGRLTARLAPLLAPSTPPPPVSPARPGTVRLEALLAAGGIAALLLGTVIALHTPARAPLRLARFDAPSIRLPAPPITPADLPSIEPDEPMAPLRPAIPVAPPTAAPETVDEAELLTRAHAALRSGDATKALELCASHEKLPRTKLGQERERIAIEALLRSGRRDAAKARAERFLARFPSSSYRRRIETLLTPPGDALDHKR